MATREETYTAPSSHEHAVNQVLTRVYTLNWEAIAYTIIIVLALITRFVDLGTRVMSHDESLHTYYSWRLYEFGGFDHTPLMHGPLLFHMTALSYFLFGDSDFTARIYPALLGVLVVGFPALFRRWLGRIGAILTAIMLLISPELLYYSRYIRHDIPTIFFGLVLLYAILQYVDGAQPRRPVWVWVMVTGLIGMLASKEVAFMYILLFGSFILLFWAFRVFQDVGIARRPLRDRFWEAPPLQLLLGHLILFGLVVVFAVPMGGLFRFIFSSEMYISSAMLVALPIFVVIYLPLATAGWFRNGMRLPPGVIPGNQKRAEKSKQTRRGGVASAIMAGLADGQSALRVIMAGVILGAVLALLIICMIDVIKPDQVWTQTVARSQNDFQLGSNGTKEYATVVGFDSAMFVRLVTWIGLPLLALIFILFLTAVFKYPGHMPLPWRELLLILLLAVIVAGVLVMVERHTFIKEASTDPFAADPTASVTQDGEKYNNIWIIGAWALGSLVTLGVAASKLFTPLWDFLNREPIFDMGLVIFTMVLPWAAAYPLFRAGYNLGEYNPSTAEGQDTVRAGLLIIVPFFMVSTSLGLAWNWRRWLPAAAIFLGIFGFFFTTVFSNQNGLVTGMIGSLGYWLEQQGVRRGSQPQYYYMLTQVPVYEFLPLIGSMLAGVTGLSKLWTWRRDRTAAALEAQAALVYGSYDDVEPVDESLSLEERMRLAEERHAEAALPPVEESAATVISAAQQTEFMSAPNDELSGAPVSDTPLYGVPHTFGLPQRLFRPFDIGEEYARRAADPEWVGAFPFLLLVGYWAIMITLALTIAGEKMPWLTTHITVPMILLSGWWLGTVFEGVRWSRLREGGWLVLLVMMPLALMGFSQVVLGFWGKGAPFRGRSVEDLTASGSWLAALLIFIGALYLIGRIGRRLGWVQLGRMAILSGATILAIITARAAYIASFIDYDYATEYLVYAHAGPAVKTVMEEVDRIATITNEGPDMRIVFDDESSWPYTWYFRDYTNYGFLRGEAGNVDPTSLDGARIVVVGNKKASDVRRILGDRYYEFQYIRLWWPMQEYFNLTYARVANVFGGDLESSYFRDGIFDIWWNRDYSTYAQAMCIEGKVYRCDQEAEWGTNDAEKQQYRTACEMAVVNECVNDSRFEVNQWPVSDRMYFFVDKQLAAQVWDAGIGSATVDIREPAYPEDDVFRDITADAILGQDALLNTPRGIAVADDGLIYVADTVNSRIAVMDSDGVLVRTIGDTVGSDGQLLLNQPWGVALGPEGNVYVADTWHHRVVVFAPDGTLLNTWGHYGIAPDDSTNDAFWGPRDIAVGPDHLVYVADTGGKRVRVYTLNGDFVRDIGGVTVGLNQLDEPVGLAFNPVSGNLYVAEAWNRRVQEFDPTGLSQRSFEVNMWFQNRNSPNRPYLAVSPDGTLIFVTDMDDRFRIVAYNLAGQPVYSFNHPDNLEISELGLRNPAGMAFGPDGRLYVVDAQQSLVFVFPPPEVSGSVMPVDPNASAFDPISPDDPGSESDTETDADTLIEPETETETDTNTDTEAEPETDAVDEGEAFDRVPSPTPSLPPTPIDEGS